jgi:hypothetical protein
VSCTDKLLLTVPTSSSLLLLLLLLTVAGVIQESEKPSAVLPDNDPEGLDFRWIEVPAMVSNLHHRAGMFMFICLDTLLA